jgi:protein-tyrosine-phosphatase
MRVASAQKPLNVLFLCTGNSARSQMAEVILNWLGAGKFRAFSAGSQPAGYVHPMALQMLKNAHYDTSKLRSKPWDEFARPDAPQLDFVFTVCDNAAKEVCPIWPGQPMTAHWGLRGVVCDCICDPHTRWDLLCVLWTRHPTRRKIGVANLGECNLWRDHDGMGNNTSTGWKNRLSPGQCGDVKSTSLRHSCLANCGSAVLRLSPRLVQCRRGYRSPHSVRHPFDEDASLNAERVTMTSFASWPTNLIAT